MAHYQEKKKKGELGKTYSSTVDPINTNLKPVIEKKETSLNQVNQVPILQTQKEIQDLDCPTETILAKL